MMIFSRPVFLTSVNIQNQGSHPTLGMQLQNDDKGPKILICNRGTLSAQIPQWKQILKNGIIYSINDKMVHTDSNVKRLIQNCNKDMILIQIIPPNTVDIHPDTGIPQINFDQFIHISEIHQDIILDKAYNAIQQEQDNVENIVINKLSKDTLIRTKLQKQSDWNDWELSEFLQLDQYQRQNMFGEPDPLPTDHTDSRCVANDAPHLKGSITLAHTYAACIDQPACRLFWAITAMKCKLILGSDAVNAFAEAPLPKCPLYLKIDAAYRNWYKHKNNVDLPLSSYVRVHQAIQGHPESPRLWQKHIDLTLHKIGFTPTTHEPCIYILYTSTETVGCTP